MKAVLSGNEAVARGLWEAGGGLAVAYPGTPSTEILENCGRYPELVAQWAINEKVALEVAAGSAIGGVRSLCAMKHVGLNVAADPLFTLSYTGVGAGLVIVTADDPQMHSSQNEQDNRHYARAAKLPMLEPSDSAEAMEFVKEAFRMSEAYDTPVLLRLTTRLCHVQCVVELSDREEVEPKPYKKDFEKYVMLPVNARKRHPIVENRLKELRKAGKSSPCNRTEKGKEKYGFITSGISYQYVKEAYPTAPVLKYGQVFPLNTELARRFTKKVEKVYVVEEGDAFLEDQLKAVGIPVHKGKERTGFIGELNADLVRQAFGKKPKKGLQTDMDVPGRPPALCAGCIHRGIFTALKKEKATVFGDIGCYTLAALPPVSTMDTCICMGASISASTGMSKAMDVAGKREKLACTLGDSTFMHSGVTGLIDAVHNNARFVVCILDNRVTAMTGQQNNPVTGKNLRGEKTHKIDLKRLVRACGVKYVDTVGGYDVEGIRKILQKHWEYDEMSVLIVQEPCIQVSKKNDTSYATDPELCVGCKQCTKIGCPAVNFDLKAKKSSIDALLCVGCGLCADQCKFSAIYRIDLEEEHRKQAVEVLKKRKEKKNRQGE